MFRCNYVLPDGITHTKGFVKDPDEANRYLALDEKSPSGGKDEVDQEDADVNPRERRNTDLTKTVYISFNEVQFLAVSALLAVFSFGRNLP